MRLFRLVLAGILSLFVNFQALSIPTTLVQQSPGQVAHVHAASTNQISRNWSGYAATGGTFTGVSGTWQIPKNPTDSSYGIDATWVGIGGVTTDDLIQAGTQTMVDMNGQPSYEAFIERLPDPSEPVDLSVHGGDTIHVSVIKHGPTSWDISLEDKTTGGQMHLTTSYVSSLSSADWVEEAPSGQRDVLPLDNFGTVHFSGVMAVENGQRVTLSQANAQPMHMGNDAGSVLAVASVVGQDGTSFSVSRTSTPSTSPTFASPWHFHQFGSMPFMPRGF